jgi:hypothetical protein
MPRNHDRRRTPQHLRRAPKGSTVTRLPSGFHTLESFQHFATLQERLRVNSAETLRQALALAVHVEPLRQLALKSGGWEVGDHDCLVSNAKGHPAKCLPLCAAVRLALQALP